MFNVTHLASMLSSSPGGHFSIHVSCLVLSALSLSSIHSPRNIKRIRPGLCCKDSKCVMIGNSSLEDVDDDADNKGKSVGDPASSTASRIAPSRGVISLCSMPPPGSHHPRGGRSTIKRGNECKCKNKQQRTNKQRKLHIAYYSPCTSAYSCDCCLVSLDFLLRIIAESAYDTVGIILMLGDVPT